MGHLPLDTLAGALSKYDETNVLSRNQAPIHPCRRMALLSTFSFRDGLFRWFDQVAWVRTTDSIGSTGAL
jgi:hypothetical protein